MLAPGRSAYWQTVTGRLLRIEVATGKVTRIALGGATFPNGDGLLVQGNLLHGVQNREERIVPVLLRERATRGVAGPG